VAQVVVGAGLYERMVEGRDGVPLLALLGCDNTQPWNRIAAEALDPENSASSIRHLKGGLKELAAVRP